MEQQCSQCRHFHQHYAKSSGGRYIEVPCGHCGNPRIRDKKPATPACHRFSKRSGAAVKPAQDGQNQ